MSEPIPINTATDIAELLKVIKPRLNAEGDVELTINKQTHRIDVPREQETEESVVIVVKEVG